MRDAPSALTRMVRLGLALAVLLVVVYVLAPLPLQHFGPMRVYDQVVQETGITPGVLFYSEVPQTRDAEMNNRDSIRYLVGKH
ncbi:MAG: hypothetical protein LBB60_09505 [Desulfovibrio sp.]|nr:hypothetical protein [Desulfovibrio sp.]